jgi:hypothetical protein
MSSNNTEWDWGWFYLRNDEPGLPPWTGKVVREKADSWWHGVSPSARQDRLDSALQALKSLADAGLGAASVIANLHHRRIAPLMERRPRIFEMHKEADPVVLAQSRLLPDLLPREYARHEGEARRQPQGCQKRRRRALVVRHAPLRPVGECIPAPFSLLIHGASS